MACRVLFKSMVAMRVARLPGRSSSFLKHQKCSTFLVSRFLSGKLKCSCLNECSEWFCSFWWLDRRYSEKHEWVQLEQSDPSVGTVGITSYAQEALGDVVYVQVPDLDSTVGQDGEFAAACEFDPLSNILFFADEVGAVESVKAANEIYTPVSGQVVEVNQALEDKPGLINSSCYDQGWIFKVKLSDPKELDGLMNDEQYSEYLKTNVSQ